MSTLLDKALKRQASVDGVDYTLVIDPEGFRLTGKGRRRPEVALRWQDLLSGDTALAVALNASLSGHDIPPATPPPPVAPKAPVEVVAAKRRPRG